LKNSLMHRVRATKTNSATFAGRGAGRPSDLGFFLCSLEKFAPKVEKSQNFLLDTFGLKCYRFPESGKGGKLRRENFGTVCMNAYASELEEGNNPPFEKTGVEISATKEGTTKKEKKIFFETKTMAEVYEKQGHTAIALEIYKRILQKNHSDSEAQKRIVELENKLSSRREKLVRTHEDPSKEGNST
jgi:hypothetical protein